MKRPLRSLAAAALLLAAASPLKAEDVDPLRFFEEEAKVVTASRREQPISEAPVAVDVVTREEIMASGAVNIWDLLRYRAGMNVIDAHPTGGESNRAIVSVRGFAESFARRLLVLVDGRRAYSANGGGVSWASLPVQVQDIERIEIVRGPNAALYGSGAGLGVINIITQRPAAKTAASVVALAGNRGQVQTSETFAAGLKGLAYRLSHTYLAQGPYDAVGGGAADDYYRGHKANVRAGWSPSSDSELEVHGGGSWSLSGLEDGHASRARVGQDFEMVKYSRSLAEDSKVELLASRDGDANSIDSPVPAIQNDLHVDQYNAEALHRLDWDDGRMKTTYGVDAQLARAYSPQSYPGRNAQDRTARVYLNQTGRVRPDLLWTAAVSWEARDSGAPQPNYQASQLWSPIENHSLRLSYSVAHLSPNLRFLRVEEPNAGGTIVGNQRLEPETLTSYEAGYRVEDASLLLSAEADAFYTDVNKIQDVGLAAGAPLSQMFGNVNHAIARGAEAQLKRRFGRGRSLYANYTYEKITDTAGNQGEITRNTPAHAANFGAMGPLVRGLSAGINLGYKDGYFVQDQAGKLASAVAPYWRLDARVSYALPGRPDAACFIAGQNLLSPRHVEYADGLTVPRTFSGGISLKF